MEALPAVHSKPRDQLASRQREEPLAGGSAGSSGTAPALSLPSRRGLRYREIAAALACLLIGIMSLAKSMARLDAPMNVRP